MNSATGKSWTDNVGEADWWYTDLVLRNINWNLNDTIITKIDYQPENGGSSHAGYYAITGLLGQAKGDSLLFPEATLRLIPAPQIIEVRDEAGEADFFWEAAQSAGDINLIAGYLLYSFQTTDENYQPTDNDTWDQVDGLITETSHTVAGLDSNNTYFFALRIVYPDGFSTTHISGNSAAVKVNPPADENQISSDLGGATLPGMGGCGADGHLGFGFLPLFGMFFLRRKK
ncbi:MAG: fibronectin type III domain-containing protein [Proteobacteria bacterium]|nr:fibronectin type III domain-containing protein [Pseudomonadota bacterium]